MGEEHFTVKISIPGKKGNLGKRGRVVNLV